MKIFLYAFSLLCIAAGCCTILYTREMRHFVKRMFNEIDRKILSVFDAVLGVWLLLSATASHHPWFIRFVGLLAIIEGATFFLLPKTLYDEFASWYVDSASDQTYRLFGILSLIFGSAMLSWVI